MYYYLLLILTIYLSIYAADIASLNLFCYVENIYLKNHFHYHKHNSITIW